jgi:hypothetical protein
MAAAKAMEEYRRGFLKMDFVGCWGCGEVENMSLARNRPCALPRVA